MQEAEQRLVSTALRGTSSRNGSAARLHEQHTERSQDSRNTLLYIELGLAGDVHLCWQLFYYAYGQSMDSVAVRPLRLRCPAVNKMADITLRD